MPRSIVLAVLVAVVGLSMFAGARDTDSAFHIMRIWGVMGGAGSNATVQYVELRMPDSGQNFIGTHHLCFYDAAGTPIARFRYPASVANGATGASILVGTEEFDAAWSAGAPDFLFEGNSVSLPSGAAIALGDPNPIFAAPAGKVAFGTDSTAIPASMCLGSFFEVDTVAYGTTYTGATLYPPAVNADLTISATNILKLVGPFCHPSSFQGNTCAMARNNDTDYDVLDANAAGNNPRNNAGQSGTVTPPPPSDDDADGVANASDLCPATAPAAPVDANGCSQAQVDADADTICDPGAVSGGPGPCTGADNCPHWPNTAQGLPAWSVATNDTDCDGFSSTVVSLTRAPEPFVGTTTTTQCAATTMANDEPGSDMWPVDFNDSRSANLVDVLQFVGKLNYSSPNPLYIQRFDLSGDGGVNLVDVLKMIPFMNKSCS